MGGGEWQLKKKKEKKSPRQRRWEHNCRPHFFGLFFSSSWSPQTLAAFNRSGHPGDLKAAPEHPPSASQERGAGNEPKGRRKDAASLFPEAPATWEAPGARI